MFSGSQQVLSAYATRALASEKNPRKEVYFLPRVLVGTGRCWID